MSFTEEWDYSEENPCRKETVTDKQQVYLYFYYNDQKATDDKTRFNAMLDCLEYNLINGAPGPAEKIYIRSISLLAKPRPEV